MKKLPIKLLELSGGTQQRPLDMIWVERLKALIADGTELPPVDVVFDGKHHWLWDGFHRIKAYQELGIAQINATVRSGTKREAIWLSYSANAKHGLQRPSGSLKYIIATILMDDHWKKKSDIEIARHVGCTRQYVFTQRNKGKESAVPPETEDKKPVSKPKTKKSVNNLHPATEPPEMLDKEGGNIPFDLRERWLGRSAIQDKINRLDQIKNCVKHAIEDGNISWGLLNQTAFEADITSLRNRLIAALPHALCCYCGGKGCGGCHNIGFLNELSWKAAPKNEISKKNIFL